MDVLAYFLVATRICVRIVKSVNNILFAQEISGPRARSEEIGTVLNDCQEERTLFCSSDEGDSRCYNRRALGKQ